VETWGGCAFINLDDNAPPLLDCLGEGVARMDARNVDRLKVDWWSSTILPVNWKLAMEAFMEGYHVMATHPQLHAVTTPEGRRYGADSPLVSALPPSESARKYVDMTLVHLAKLSEGMGGMIHGWELEVAETLRHMDLPDNVGAGAMAFYARLREEITSQGRAQNRPVPDLTQAAADHPFSAVEYFFPNYFLLPMFSSMSSYRARPLGPESCLFEIWSLAMFPEDEHRPAPTAPATLAYDDPGYPEIPKQDYSNLPRQQLGLHAGGFEFMRLSPQIEGMISNYQRLIDGYLAGLPAPALARGAALASGGFDAPIADLGF
jgi:phenylpropionate dioxygenase-like ring-hydroxylating dioxygenase large terminal subunit